MWVLFFMPLVTQHDTFIPDSKFKKRKQIRSFFVWLLTHKNS